jgi:hypothetical protein
LSLYERVQLLLFLRRAGKGRPLPVRGFAGAKTLEEKNPMMRVVDLPPGPEEIKASGLAEKDFRIDPDAYRYFVEQYRRDRLAFGQARSGGNAAATGSADRHFAGQEAADVTAFDRSRPPYHYHRNAIYRYRIDPAGPAERPIILESLERSEITGSLLGLPFTSQRRSLLMRLALWIEERLRAREEKG